MRVCQGRFARHPQPHIQALRCPSVCSTPIISALEKAGPDNRPKEVFACRLGCRNCCHAVIRASKLGLQILLYKPCYRAWIAIKPMLPNKHAGGRYVNAGRGIVLARNAAPRFFVTRSYFCRAIGIITLRPVGLEISKARRQCRAFLPAACVYDASPCRQNSPGKPQYDPGLTGNSPPGREVESGWQACRRGRGRANARG